MSPTHIIQLEFNPVRDDLGKGKELRDGLSVALQVGSSLWVANDETVSLERLTLGEAADSGTSRTAAQHTQFPLSDFLRLPVPVTDPDAVEEVDIEGLDHEDGYLWLVGSHSLKRKAPGAADSGKAARKRLASLGRDGNRYLLARIPVEEKDGASVLVKRSKGQRRTRTAAQLRGDAQGNELTQALRDDEHLAPFLDIPGKDNGFDIEGMAVRGKRVFLGLRGPVLRGWAVVLELEMGEVGQDDTLLELKPIGRGKRLYRKHFLQLGGLGIRDLCRHGKDLLVLAGPTMQLDGPVTVYRWRGGAAATEESVVRANELETVLEVPYGEGVDHAEGLALYSGGGKKADSLLVVFDSASVRRQLGDSVLLADVYPLKKGAKA